MARQIVWTTKAQEDRKQILSYWKERNQSNLYSKKLNSLFKEALEFVSEYPTIGKKTSLHNVRAKVVRD